MPKTYQDRDLEHALQVLRMAAEGRTRSNDGREIKYEAAEAAHALDNLINGVTYTVREEERILRVREFQVTALSLEDAEVIAASLVPDDKGDYLPDEVLNCEIFVEEAEE